MVDDGLYLLFDYVHPLKNIRNNWLTEPNGELESKHKGEALTTRWEHLLTLQNLEEKASANDSGVRGMSNLNKIAVRPKPNQGKKF